MMSGAGLIAGISKRPLKVNAVKSMKISRRWEEMMSAASEATGTSVFSKFTKIGENFSIRSLISLWSLGPKLKLTEETREEL
jgi:hypothetical protein